jgi:hypothetical protein
MEQTGKSNRPWEQQPGEPDAAHARFLVYLQLGPARSLRMAQNAATNRDKSRQGKKSVSGGWSSDCVKFDWVARARAYDIAHLAEAVPESANAILRMIHQSAVTALQHLQEGKLKPRTWDQLNETVVILANFISPEVITKTLDHATDLGVGEPSSEK